MRPPPGDREMNTLAFVNNPMALVIILVVVLLLFGGQKIPEMMRGLGQGAKEFKKGLSDNSDDDELRREREREAEVKARVEEEMRREREARNR